MFKYLRKNEKGFTLIELVVVIAIIGILAAVVAPQAFKAIDKSRVAAAESDLKAIKSAVINYYTDTSEWPETAETQDEATNTFVTGNNLPSTWNGPYLERWPAKNPWGGEYQYHNDYSDGDVEIKKGYKYILMTNVPDSAKEQLEKDLDGGTVDSSNSTSDSDGVIRWTTTKEVYFIISEK